MAKTVAITGASKGIGAATARLFAAKGYNVIIGYNNSKSSAEELRAELTNSGYNVEICYVDITHSASADLFIQKTVSTFGGIDILVNNAGIAEQKLFTEITDEDWHKMISTNLSGAFYCCRAAAKYFIKKKDGCIINISSMWGETGASLEVHYSAAKAGVIGLTKALAKELGPSNIKVNCITPGVIDTDMNSNLDTKTLNSLAEETPLCKIGTPLDVAKAVVFLAEANGFITGQILGVNGGMVI
jgi:3-oxoacyl-[acyl-carrier protein] reductase